MDVPEMYGSGLITKSSCIETSRDPTELCHGFLAARISTEDLGGDVCVGLFVEQHRFLVTTAILAR